MERGGASVKIANLRPCACGIMQSLSRAMPRGRKGNQAERCHCIEHALGKVLDG
jgi:hypothetical protein